MGEPFDELDDFPSRVRRSLQIRRISVGHGQGVQRRVHVTGIDSLHPDSVRLELLVPDPAHMQECGLACAVCSPARVGCHRRIAGDVDDQRRSTRTGGCAKRPEEGFGEAKRADHIRRQCGLQVFAIRVGQQLEWDGTQARCIVDEYIEPTECRSDLHGDGVRRVLLGHVARNAVGSRVLSCHFAHPVLMPSDERHGGPSVV